MHAAWKSLALVALIAGCGSKDVILSGTREAIVPAADVVARPGAALSLPGASTNTEWTHRAGNARHDPGHVALARQLSLAFVAPVGAKETRRNRITADPVIGGGRVFAMDAMAQVTALSPAGQVLWTRAVAPASDGPREGAGGGLAYAGGVLFVTTGYGRVMALDAATGQERWTQKLEAPGGAAPTVANGTVYVAARNGLGWAVDADTGRVQWQLVATTNVARHSAGGGAAATSNAVLFPFPGAELRAAFPLSGQQRWSTVIAGDPVGSAAAATFQDISGDPVIDGARVYAGNASGETVALNVANGEQIWSVPLAAKHPVAAAGNSVFMVTADNRLARVASNDGAVVWQTELPQYAERRWRDPNRYYAHYGPILAGGRLIVASSDGYLRGFNPATGAMIEQIELPAPAAAAPAVAQGVLYVMLSNGQLAAFR